MLIKRTQLSNLIDLIQWELISKKYVAMLACQLEKLLQSELVTSTYIRKLTLSEAYAWQNIWHNDRALHKNNRFNYMYNLLKL